MPELSKPFHQGSEEALAELFQEAALDASRWPSALASLSDAVSGAGAVLFSTSERLTLQHSPDVAEVLDCYRRENWDVRDERYRGIPTMLRNGIATESDFIETDEIERSPYYREFLERFGLRWFAGLGFSLGGSLYCIAMQRRIEQNPFEPAEIQRLERMLVPIHETITIAEKLGAIHTTGLLQTLEDVAQPALVCDVRGGIVAINVSAERLFSPFIDPSSKLLRFADFQSQANFDALLKSAARREGRRPSETTTTIRDARGFAHPVRAVVLDRWIAALHADARILLLLPPNTTPADTHVILRETFGLTQAEATLARDLAGGHSLMGIAEKCGITYETARSRLKIVFRKTGVHRQAELVALLAKLG